MIIDANSAAVRFGLPAAGSCASEMRSTGCVDGAIEGSGRESWNSLRCLRPLPNSHPG
jgi:hypothetical protein